MADIPPVMRSVFARLRDGDEASAIALLRDAPAGERALPQVRGFLGMLLCRTGALEEGIAELRGVIETAPGDVSARGNLVTALLSLQRIDDAADVLGPNPASDVRLRRLQGFMHQERGALMEARAAYEDVVRQVPDDFEALNNLGNVRLELHDAGAAIDALRRAIAIRADLAPIHLNLSRALMMAGRSAERAAVLGDAARTFPDDAAILLEHGLAEAHERRFDAAERALRRSAAIAPADPAAYVELTLFYENLNRLDELDALVDEARDAGVPAGEVAFIEAWALRRRGRFADALAIADTVPATIVPMRRHQLAAELADRVGLAERAFAEFAAMNREAAILQPAPSGEIDYVEEVRGSAVRIAAMPADAWIARAPPATAPASPIFIAGFPRSGTTLIDTLLMNLPGVHVLEERPVLDPVRALLRDPARLPALPEPETSRLRRLYFDTLHRIEPSVPRRATIVDKHPFHMVRADLIHRLFPDARIVFMERHPCDVVLSCFMQNFELNRAMRPFGTLDGAAALYDAAFDCWEATSARLPLRPHRLRYERMIADLEGEMRALVAFLGVAWDPAILDNEGAAARRRHITTASYAQVGQPIYARAIGRWERYRAQMASVLPILAPWAERMGYAI